MTLRIITPTGTACESEPEYVSLPLTDGSMGVLAHHAPTIAALGSGTISYRIAGNSFESAVHGGIAEIKNDVITVLTYDNVPPPVDRLDEPQANC